MAIDAEQVIVLGISIKGMQRAGLSRVAIQARLACFKHELVAAALEQVEAEA